MSYQGYSPAEARAIARQIDAAAERAANAVALAQYTEYRAESRACGYEVETFSEWKKSFFDREDDAQYRARADDDFENSRD